MTGLQKTDDHRMEPGTWKFWTIDGLGSQVVLVCCPGCGTKLRLDEGHEIAIDGRITPSLDCPMERCTFHDMAKLDDWEP